MAWSGLGHRRQSREGKGGMFQSICLCEGPGMGAGREQAWAGDRGQRPERSPAARKAPGTVPRMGPSPR